MSKLILKIYDLLRKRPGLGWILFSVLTAILVMSVLTLSYKEDISDFLPLDENNQTALSVYQDVSGANKIFAIISTRDTVDVDPQELADGVEMFVDKVETFDTLHYIKDIMKEIDMDKMLGVADEVYNNIPYFLTDGDYERIDSLLADPGYVDSQISEDKQMLLFPSSNLLTANISRDPLNLFTPILGRLKQAGMSIEFETYDGYILSPDSKKAIVILESSFGARESENNTSLVSMLEIAADETEKTNSNLDVHLIGGPVIAVSNAGQIKNDSVLAVCIAGILIMLLLIYVFRNIRNILLIVVSVGWGWLFAMGAIALYYDSVSIIVIGIASVILGIAVNYPLHLIDHLSESNNPRAALKEIISPLVVGNVTTVGAFLCLVPLNSPALHDLGLFSSLLLIGTILFVLVFLPHIVRTRRTGGHIAKEPLLITRLAGISVENSKWFVWSVLGLTLLFGYYSFRTEFDSDMRNINYMTDEQKEDMSYFQSLQGAESNTESLYVVSSGRTWEEALAQNETISPELNSLIASGTVYEQNNVSAFLLSEREQEARLIKWNDFVYRHKELFQSDLPSVAAKYGFSKEAFSKFGDILNRNYVIHDFEYFKGFISTVFMGSISEDKDAGRKSLVRILSVPDGAVEHVKSRLSENREFGGLFFDVKSMNGSIANTLSDDFNYIGIACGCIVFVFLWISLGSIELAIVSFMPMAFSWIWILGIMGMLGIKFNIVNIILATFIFGQGDDYTIFMTEGLSYEFAYRKKLLASYKNSIVVSALIMFIGIGTLVFARHPAMRSLGEVTVVGMLSVVLMAYLFPPLIFKWLTQCNGKLRYRPVTLKKILHTVCCAFVFSLQLISAYIMGLILFVVTKPTVKKRTFFRRYNSSLLRFDLKWLPGIRFIFINLRNESFDRPAVIMCSNLSILDCLSLIAVVPEVVIYADRKIKMNPIVERVLKWGCYYIVSRKFNGVEEEIGRLVSEGFSIAVFPMRDRKFEDDRIVGLFEVAPIISRIYNIDLLPVYIDGTHRILPDGTGILNGGKLFIEIGKRILRKDLSRIAVDRDRYELTFLELCTEYIDHMILIHQIISTVEEVLPVVRDRYLYKGRDIERSADKLLKEFVKQKDRIEEQYNESWFLVQDMAGNGELALLLALMYPNKAVYCRLKDEDSRDILKGCIDNFVENIYILEDSDASPDRLSPAKKYIVTPACEVIG